jgi:putative FmdB family regulatory protein
MPTYEYKCAQGHTFERFQRMTEAPIDRCPTCGSPAERLISAGAGLLFKGSGFYITDYRSESYKKAAAADAPKADSAKSDAGKADSGKGDSGKGDTGKGDTGASRPASGGTSSASE